VDLAAIWRFRIAALSLSCRGSNRSYPIGAEQAYTPAQADLTGSAPGRTKDTILTEEQEPVCLKGFAHPVRVYRVVGIYDKLEKDRRIIREERQVFGCLST
jgi:hypothetical protein